MPTTASSAGNTQGNRKMNIEQDTYIEIVWRQACLIEIVLIRAIKARRNRHALSTKTNTINFS
jgi:hypothetical protein